MIDLATETRIPIAVAAAEMPPGRNGKKTHLSTILRWIMSGAKAPDGRRVRLEGVHIGGRWFVTRESLQRFADALTPTFPDDPADAQPAPRSPSRRQRASERAARELEKAGI